MEIIISPGDAKIRAVFLDCGGREARLAMDLCNTSQDELVRCATRKSCGEPNLT